MFIKYVPLVLCDKYMNGLDYIEEYFQFSTTTTRKSKQQKPSVQIDDEVMDQAKHIVRNFKETRHNEDNEIPYATPLLNLQREYCQLTRQYEEKVYEILLYS
jgi:tRNA 2-selenouridine synthase SelU